MRRAVKTLLLAVAVLTTHALSAETGVGAPGAESRCAFADSDVIVLMALQYLPARYFDKNGHWPVAWDDLESLAETEHQIATVHAYGRDYVTGMRADGRNLVLDCQVPREGQRVGATFVFTPQGSVADILDAIRVEGDLATPTGD